jgi:hypothetical protein
MTTIILTMTEIIQIIQQINSLVNPIYLIIPNAIILISALFALFKAIKCKYKTRFKIYPIAIIITLLLNICQFLA